MSNIQFKNVEEVRFKRIFLKVLEKYSPLQYINIHLVQRPMKKTTMRAQPYIWSLSGPRENWAYKIEFSDNTHLKDRVKLSRTEDEVLFGWFAHELGHIMDYQRHGFLGMLRFGLFYMMSSNYRIGAERRADLYAIEHGMSEEILATKNFILEHSSLSAKYKSYISKYYMSPDEVLMMLKGEERPELRMDEVNVFGN